MADIVERLRAAANHPYNQHGPQEWLAEAADTITRLTARVAELEGALTPSAETKAAYIGEFHFTEYYMDEDGNDAWRKITVPWDTVKEIMAAIRARAALTKGERTPSFGDFVEGCDYLPVPSTKGESHD